MRLVKTHFRLLPNTCSYIYKLPYSTDSGVNNTFRVFLRSWSTFGLFRDGCNELSRVTINIIIPMNQQFTATDIT